MSLPSDGWQLSDDDVEALGEALDKAYTASLGEYLGPKLLEKLPSPDAFYDAVAAVVDGAVTWHFEGIELEVFPGFDEAGEKIEGWWIELFHRDEDGETRKLRLDEVLATGVHEGHGGSPRELAAWLREMADKLDGQRVRP